MGVRPLLIIATVSASALLVSCSHDETLSFSGSSFGLFYNDQGSTVALAYGRANSDDVALMLQCAKGSGRIEVTDVLRKSPAPKLVLTSGGRRTELEARVEPGESDAPRLVAASTTSQADALKAFRSTGSIHVAFGQVRYGLQATPTEQAGVERFFSVCGPRA